MYRFHSIRFTQSKSSLRHDDDMENSYPNQLSFVTAKPTIGSIRF